MNQVVILWLAATIAAVHSTENPEKGIDVIKLGNDRDSADSAARPAINPSTIASFNQESQNNNLENQDKENDLQEEEERFEDIGQPNLVNGENVIGNSPIESEPAVAIPGSVYEDLNIKPVQSKWPPFFSGLFSHLPSWITSYTFKWPFKKPIFSRAEILYPEYNPDDDIEQRIYTYY